MESALVYLIIDLQIFFLPALLPIITYGDMYLTVITIFFYYINLFITCSALSNLYGIRVVHIYIFNS